MSTVETGPGPLASWFRLLGSELRLIASRRRNIVGLCALAAVPVVIALSVRLWGAGDLIYLNGTTGNGLFVAWSGLGTEMTLLLPLAIAAVAGDAVAGEASVGTLRYLLTVPVGRTRLLSVKYAGIVIAALATTVVIAVAGVVSGLLMFGAGPTTMLSGNQISLGAGLARLLLACGYVAAGMAALGAIGLFVSTLTEQPISATITVVLITGCMFLADNIGQLDWLHPWLLAHWWTYFVDLMREPIFPDNLIRGLLAAIVYATAAVLAAWAHFRSKDITS